MRFDSKTQRAKRLKLTAANERELSEIAAVADATTSVEKRSVVAAVGGSPSSPPMITAQGTPRALPRLTPEEARSRQVEAPVPVKPELIVEGPAEVWPTLGGGEIVRGVPAPREPEAAPISQPDEWAAAPVSLPLAGERVGERVSTASAARLADEPAPASAKVVAKDLEMIFMQRAEDSIEKGTCDRFLLGLEDIAQDSERNARSEQARVLRARCFDSQLRPRQALNEYRKYLDEYARGRFVDEAHKALGE